MLQSPRTSPGGDLPEVLPDHESFPEVRHEDLPHVVSLDFPEVYHPRLPQQQSWWKRNWIWLPFSILLILGALIGGAIGGTRHKSVPSPSGGTSQPTSTPDGKLALQTTVYPIPTAISRKPGRIDAFGKTVRETLWFRAYQEGSWDHDFQLIRPSLNPNTNVAAVARYQDSIDLCFVGRDNSTYQKGWNDTDNTWLPRNDVGWPQAGNIWSTIEVVSWSNVRMDLFAIDPARKLIHKIRRNRTDFGNWIRAPGDGGSSTYLYAPTAVIWSSRRGHVFVVDEKTLEVQESVWEQDSNDDTVYPIVFRSIGGQCTSRPAAVAWRDTRIDLVCRGLDARLIWTSYTEDKWSDWVVAGKSPEIADEPHIISYAEGQLDAVVRSKDSSIHMGFCNTESSIGWQWHLAASGVKGSPRAVSYGNMTDPRAAAFIYAGNNSLLFLSYNRTNSVSSLSGFKVIVEELGLSSL